MSSYTIELQWLLRGFTPMNENPYLYASPQSLIEQGRENFFKAVGNYPFKIWGDERDQQFKEEFERAFLERFMMSEIGYKRPQAFYLQLGSFLRRKMPIYTTHWKHILNEMYITSTSNTVGNTVGNNVQSDARTTGDKSHTDTEGSSDTKSHSDTNGISRSGLADTPQNNLDIDLDHLGFASQVTKSDSKTTADSTSQSETKGHTESGDYNVSIGNTESDSVTDSITDNKGRNKDVFDIYDQWIKSGYDLFSPVFQEMMREQLFVVFN
ncbi:lower collar protein [Enterococcus sp. DIV0240a]|uniref:lower collar protein n=1 Tax=Enterococcus sp. DIV0240a TaxID=2774651 RepID=UPI003D2A0931